MKITIFNGNQTFTEELAPNEGGMDRDSYVAAGGNGAIWDFLYAGGVTIDPPAVVSPLLVTENEIQEGESVTFTDAVFSGTEPLTITETATLDGTPITLPVSRVFEAALDSEDHVLVVSQTATNTVDSITSTVTVNISRIPLGPVFEEAPWFSVATGVVGEELTLDIGTVSGDAPMTVEFTLTSGVNDYTSSVDAQTLTYTPVAVTENLVLTVIATNNVDTVTMSSSIPVVAAPPLNIDPETAQFMFVPSSQAHNLVRDSWGGPGSTQHNLDDVFRPEYTGPGGGTASSSSLKGETISSPLIPPYQEALYGHWDGSVTFEAGGNPGSVADLTGKDVLVLPIATIGWISTDGGNIGNPNSLDVSYNSGYQYEMRRLNEPAVLGFVEAAADAGMSGVIFLAEPPDLPAAAIGTDDSVWRTMIDNMEAAAHYYQDLARRWLDDNGHANMFCRVAPIHRLAARLYDDAQIGTVIPGNITDHRYFRSGYSSGTETHVYMFNDIGAWALRAIFRLTCFGTMPPGTLTTSFVDQAMVDYLTGICLDIVGDYARAGQGGTDYGQLGIPSIEGETYSTLLGPNSVIADIAECTLWEDRARSIPATDGGLVGAISTPQGVHFTAVNDGGRATVNGADITFVADRMPATLGSSMLPKYFAGLIVMPSVVDTYLMGLLDSTDLRYGAGDRIYVDTWHYQGVTTVQGGPWSGEQIFVETFEDNGLGVMRMVRFVGGDAVVVGTNSMNFGQASSVMRLAENTTGRLFLMSADVPTIEERRKLYDVIERQTGIRVW